MFGQLFALVRFLLLSGALSPLSSVPLSAIASHTAPPFLYSSLLPGREVFFPSLMKL
jgi:hypothetical protein